MKRVILLNGASSSGKSTLATAIKESLKLKCNLEYEMISIDDFLKMTSDDVIYEDDVYDISPMLCERARELLQVKEGVIIDHVITSERIYRMLRESLQHYDFLSVHVTCPRQILKEREKQRGNRCIGSAEASLQYLYPKEGYEVMVDTYEMSVSDCVSKIIAQCHF